MKSLNRKMKEALDMQYEAYGNYIELRLNEAEYNEFIKLEGVERIQYDGFSKFGKCPQACGEQLYFKYNGNYWIPRIYEEERKEYIKMYVKVPVDLDPMCYAHIETEEEMLKIVISHIKEHFPSLNIAFEIPEEFINEYRRLRQ